MKECIKCGCEFDIDDLVSGTDICECCFVEECGFDEEENKEDLIDGMCDDCKEDEED